MTIREAKTQAIKKLKTASGAEAAIDAEILLAHTLGISREALLAHDERIVPALAWRKCQSLVARRAKHEPVAYLVGHKEFFSLQFDVNKHTLIPRPETELLVEEALKQLDTRFKKIMIDVGTGSGAIAITIAKNSSATVIATDISKQALEIAEGNAAANGVADRVRFERANLLDFKNAQPSILKGAVITANLPYLPTKVWQKCAPDVKKFEPKTALEGGKDGLKYYDELFHQIAARFPAFADRRDARRERVRPFTSQPSRNAAKNAGLIIICEIDPSQKISFPKLAKRHFPKAKVEIKNDLAGRPRIAIIKS